VTVDQAEDDLVSKGIPEDTAVDVLEVLGLFGVYEVKLKVPDEETYYRVRCLTQHEYEIDLLAAG
jgi:hypothetical protein